MLRGLLEQYGLKPGTSLMVGDTTEDYLSAAEAGIEAVIVGNGYGDQAGVPPHCRMQNLRALLSEVNSDDRS